MTVLLQLTAFSTEIKMMDVLIVGAGLAGLSCAKELIKNGLSVIVLEANDYIGGRVRPVLHPLLVPEDHPMRHSRGMVPATSNDVMGFDVGAEFVHFDRSILNKIAKENNFILGRLDTLMDRSGPWRNASVDGGSSYYYLAKEKIRLPSHSIRQNEDLSKMHKAMAKLESAKYSDKRDLETFLIDEHVPATGLAMARAEYSNTCGGALSHMSVGLSARQEKLWGKDGEEWDFRVFPSNAVLVEHFSQGVDIRLNTKVSRLHYDRPHGYTVTAADVAGNLVEYQARQVVVTAPVTMLKPSCQYWSEKIQFDPPLPVDKLQAFDAIPMSHDGIKIVMRFQNQFWPSNMDSIMCAGCAIPEVWVCNLGYLQDGKGNGVERSRPLDGYVIVGFATSSFAHDLAELTDDQMIQTFLNQLNVMFGSKEQRHPANASFQGGFVFNWHDVPFVRGAYSFAGVFEDLQSRKIYARAENENTLHFAGEACDVEGGSSTMQSAIRSGIRSSFEIMSHRSKKH